MKYLFLALALAGSSALYGSQCDRDADLAHDWLDSAGGTVSFRGQSCGFQETGASNGYSSSGTYVVTSPLAGDTSHKTGTFEMNLQGATNDQGPPNAYYRCTADWRRNDKMVSEPQSRTFQVTHTITEEDPANPGQTRTREVTETVTEVTTVQRKVGNLYTLGIRCNDNAVVQDLTREDTNTQQIAAN